MLSTKQTANHTQKKFMIDIEYILAYTYGHDDPQFIIDIELWSCPAVRNLCGSSRTWAAALALSEIAMNGLLEMKICKQCGQMKTKDEFEPHPFAADGLWNKCRECRNPYPTEEYLKKMEKIWDLAPEQKKHRDHAIKTKKEYYKKNREKIKNTSKLRHQKFKKEKVIYNHKYYMKHKKKYQEYMKKYVEEHREKINEYNRKQYHKNKKLKQVAKVLPLY